MHDCYESFVFSIFNSFVFVHWILWIVYPESSNEQNRFRFVNQKILQLCLICFTPHHNVFIQLSTNIHTSHIQVILPCDIRMRDLFSIYKQVATDSLRMPYGSYKSFLKLCIIKKVFPHLSIYLKLKQIYLIYEDFLQ